MIWTAVVKLAPPPGRPDANSGGGNLNETRARMPGTIRVVAAAEPVRVMITRLLRTQGYEIRQAASASEAKASIQEQQPDLVISDIVMPGESGIELPRT